MDLGAVTAEFDVGGFTADTTRGMEQRHRMHPDLGRTRAHAPARYARSSAGVAPCARDRPDICQDAPPVIGQATAVRTMTDQPRTTHAALPSRLPAGRGGAGRALPSASVAMS